MAQGLGCVPLNYRVGPRALRNYRESRTGESWQRGRKVSFILSGAWCPPPGFPSLALLPGRGRCSGGLLLCEVDAQTSRAGSSLFLPWSPCSWGRHPVCEPCPPEAWSPVQSLLILLNEKGGRCVLTAATRGQGRVIRKKERTSDLRGAVCSRNLRSIRASLDVHGGKEAVTYQGMGSDPELILTHKLLGLTHLQNSLRTGRGESFLVSVMLMMPRV